MCALSVQTVLWNVSYRAGHDLASFEMYTVEVALNRTLII
jgi:hypothetical protein